MTYETETSRPTWEDLNRVAEMASSKALREAFANTGHEVFRVPNTFVGRIVRWILLRYLNRKVYKMRAVGRKPVTSGLRRTYRYGLPLSLSKEIAIYIDVKRGHE